MPQSKIPPESPSLHAEVRAIAEANPGWHIWMSDTGSWWATTLYCPAYRDGCGTTIEGGTPEGLRREIAAIEHEWLVRAA